MRKTDIEYWALNVIERVEKGQPVEDSRVELKAEWIDATKAARRIAGHANAARGEPILWLIGVDEKVGVKGIDLNNFANWFSTVASCYDGVIPDSTSINVPYKSVTVLAIMFETDRAPYVVKNSLGGHITFEVPWREGTFTRSANRTQLLQILVPLQKLPTIEILSGKLIARVWQDNTWNWSLELQLYVTSMLQHPIAIPFHQCFAMFQLSHHLPETILTNLRLTPPFWGGFGPRIITTDAQRPQPDSLTIDGTSNELIIQGPGKFWLMAHVNTAPLENDITDTIARVQANLHPVDSEQKIVLITALVWTEKQETSKSDDKLWTVNRQKVP